jgi:GT2 family glycosyltransferase
MLYIFTLTWNGEDKLVKLKNSLLPCLEGLDYTWLIKDNASKDNTIETASQWGDRVKVLPYKNNQQNFSQGMNYLCEAASPKDNDQILLLNNDVIFNDDQSIKNMIGVLEKDSKVGVVGARLLFTDTDKLQHAGVVFDPRFKGPMHFRSGQVADELSTKDRLFQVVTGAVLLTKAEYFKNACTTNKSGIKGMDEKYHWAFDDVDLCLAIKYNLKKNIVYCGRTNVFHEESASLKKNPTNKLFMTHNLNLLKEKWNERAILDRDTYEKDPKYNLYLR